MPRSIRNSQGITLRYLLQNTYVNMHSRYDYMKRDVLRRFIVRKVSVYDGKAPGEARTRYDITSFSYPQYYPYYTKKDLRGRPRSYQRTYKHEYDITIQMEKLSLDCDAIKLRTGADAKWDFTKAGKGYWMGKGRNKRWVEGSNVRRGINGDHFFRLSFIRAQAGILFGRNFADRPPRKTNPHMIQFLTKHELNAIELLVNKGIIQ